MLKGKKYRVLVAWIYFMIIELLFTWLLGSLTGLLVTNLDKDDVEKAISIMTYSTTLTWLLGSFMAFYLSYVVFFKEKENT